MRNAIAAGVALVAGALLASYDLRTDDTGVEVGLLLIASITIAALAPKRWWLIGLYVGLPIPIAEIVFTHASLPPAGIAALGVAIVGSLVGFAFGRSARSATSSRPG